MRRVKIFMVLSGLFLAGIGELSCRMGDKTIGVAILVVAAIMLAFATSDPAHLFRGRRRR